MILGPKEDLNVGPEALPLSFKHAVVKRHLTKLTDSVVFLSTTLALLGCWFYLPAFLRKIAQSAYFYLLGGYGKSSYHSYLATPSLTAAFDAITTFDYKNASGRLLDASQKFVIKNAQSITNSALNLANIGQNLAVENAPDGGKATVATLISTTTATVQTS